MIPGTFRIQKAGLCSGANGLFSSIAQIIFIRELLTVFSGNELFLGMGISIWLLAGAAGNRFFKSFETIKLPWLSLISLFSCIGGILLVRTIHLFVLPGELLTPIIAVPVLILAEAPVSFFSGVVFGVLADSYCGKSVYRYDNAGNLIGLLLVTSAIYLNISHLCIMSLGVCFLLPLMWRNSGIICISLSLIFLFIIFEPMSIKWKYSGNISSVIQGRGGEIAVDRKNDLIFLNNSIYRSGGSVPYIEQAVHVPLSIRNAKKVLLIHNNGQLNEIKKYETEIHCIESEPALADSSCSCRISEVMFRNKPFDAVLLGCDIPENIASNRLFTDEFFHEVKGMLADSGLFSFTLSLNNNYLNANELKLKDLLCSTLSRSFNYVKIFPGEVYTFTASDIPFEFPTVCNVATTYFSDYILAGMSSDEIENANRPFKRVGENTAAHPMVLRFSLERYLNKFQIPAPVFISVIVLLLISVFLLFFRTAPLLSIGTTGFGTGSYTMALMMLYQAAYGNLYSKVSLLMISLTAGFVIGSFFKKRQPSDVIIGLYSAISLLVLLSFRDTPEILYFLFNAGMGILGGAQIIHFKENSWAELSSADLAGGVAGISLTSIAILPYFGVNGVVILLGAAKMVAAFSGTFFKCSRVMKK